LSGAAIDGSDEKIARRTKVEIRFIFAPAFYTDTLRSAKFHRDNCGPRFFALRSAALRVAARAMRTKQVAGTN
jgi:hypothetical protein